MVPQPSPEGQDARTYLRLGREARQQFRRTAAREFFAKAFRLDPRDPDVLFSYSEYSSDPDVRAELMEAVRDVPAQDTRILHFLARLDIARAVSARPINHIASAYRNYRL